MLGRVPPVQTRTGDGRLQRIAVAIKLPTEPDAAQIHTGRRLLGPAHAVEADQRLLAVGPAAQRQQVEEVAEARGAFDVAGVAGVDAEAQAVAFPPVERVAAQRPAPVGNVEGEDQTVLVPAGIHVGKGRPALQLDQRRQHVPGRPLAHAAVDRRRLRQVVQRKLEAKERAPGQNIQHGALF